MKTTIAASAAAAFAILGVVAWLSSEDRPAHPAPSAADSGQADARSLPHLSTGEAHSPTAPSAANSDSAPDDRRSVSTAPSTAAPALTVTPIPVSSEHRELIEEITTPGRDTRHSKLEREPKDTAWAYDIEQRLRHTFEAQGVEVFAIECRSTTCEAQTFSSLDGPDPHDRAARLPQPGLLTPTEATAMTVNGRRTEVSYFDRVNLRMQLEREEMIQRQAERALAQSQQR